MGFELTTLVVIGTDGIGSCNSNYHTIMTTTDPILIIEGMSQTYDMNTSLTVFQQLHSKIKIYISKFYYNRFQQKCHFWNKKRIQCLEFNIHWQ